MNWKKLASLGVVAMMSLSILGCGSDTASNDKAASSSSLSGSITGSGSSALLPLAKDAADKFKELHPEVSITLNGGGSGTGLKQVADGSVDIGNSDVAADTKLDKAVADGLVDHKVCVVTMAPVVNKDIAAVQPKILDYNQKQKFEFAGAAGGLIDNLGYPYCRGRVFDDIEFDNGQYDDETEIFWASGCSLFIRSADFWDMNGFDERFFAHQEEIDLCWRLKNAGRKIYYTGKSKVYHVGGGTLNKQNPQKTFLNFRNNLTMLLKN